MKLAFLKIEVLPWSRLVHVKEVLRSIKVVRSGFDENQNCICIEQATWGSFDILILFFFSFGKRFLSSALVLAFEGFSPDPPHKVGMHLDIHVVFKSLKRFLDFVKTHKGLNRCQQGSKCKWEFAFCNQVGVWLPHNPTTRIYTDPTLLKRCLPCRSHIYTIHVPYYESK